MMSMVGCSGSHVVDVVVGDRRIVEVDDNFSRIDSVICESFLVNDCDDFGDLLSSFYPELERVLLSSCWKGIIHSVVQQFEGGVSAFRIALAKYAVECGFAVNYLKNDATRVTAECMMKSSTSCKWFVHGRVLMNSGWRLTFVSDRQHGLLDALSVVFPNAHHAYCLNHLKRNLIDKLVGLRTNYKLTLMKILVKCAYTPTVASFQHYMEKLRCIARNGRVDSMLDGLQNNKWANAFFKGKRYGEMSSNAAESYNNWIGRAHELPITFMEMKFVDSLKLAKSWDVIVTSDTVLEVHSSISFYVDIGRRTCSCHEWQLNSFPCCHAVHALRSSGRDMYDCIDPFFHVDCFRESYKKFVYPMPSSERFDFDGAGSSIIKPPITKKQSGQNKKKRIPSRGKNVKQIKCGRCLKYENHNKKTCKAAI
ncbi:hypothetical protein ACSBR1_014506 [Camellia fascicularis]